jgi:hypothetical protein
MLYGLDCLCAAQGLQGSLSRLLYYCTVTVRGGVGGGGGGSSLATTPGICQCHWCQMAEFRAAGPKNGPVKFLAA